MTQDPAQTAYVQYTAPIEKQTLAEIAFVNQDGSQWGPLKIEYDHSCQITLYSAYEKLGKGDNFEIQEMSFWGRYDGDKGWVVASAVVRTFDKGDQGEVYFDPYLIGCGGTYEQYIDVTNVQGDNVEFTVYNNNDSDYEGRVDFQITLMDNSGGPSHNKRFTSQDPEVQLEKKN